MVGFDLKPSHKQVRDYYAALRSLKDLDVSAEGAVSHAFASLIRHAASPLGLTLAEQHGIKTGGRTIHPDGVVLDDFKLTHGIWEAKDSADDLESEIVRKFQRGYPRDNTLFQAPSRAVLYQKGRRVMDADLNVAEQLVEVVRDFLTYVPPPFEDWQQAVRDFKPRIPELAAQVLSLIEQERRDNPAFVRAFGAFAALCQQTINPSISIQAVEEMLIQHLLTERIFRKVFNNPDFVARNAIAHEIDQVIQALTSPYFSRDQFLQPLDRFYGAIEQAAAAMTDFGEKQAFLNTVYQEFFQGFAVNVADTMGIVYTPQPIVQFMVKSVEHLLKTEFDRSLADEGVHILDPFVGTGSFVVATMLAMPKHRLAAKYAAELHCNEVMLLPYYVAAMNIEHTYGELMGRYLPFEGICLVDTFEAGVHQPELPSFTPQNTQRVERQRQAPIFVVITNPPYNANQVNENDNNKNRKYPVVDDRVAHTYGKDSTATLQAKLHDPYVKAFRWASDRIGDEGIVAFISNNSFLEHYSMDGMRKHLAQDFTSIYHLDLKGNARTSGERRRREAGNVFDDAIRVGVGITFLVRKSGAPRPARVYLHQVDDYLKAADKRGVLERAGSVANLQWQELYPDARHTWLTGGLADDFGALMPLATRAGADDPGQVVFATHSLGVSTNRDRVVYGYDEAKLLARIDQLCDDFNAQANRYQLRGRPQDLDGFVDYSRIQWSSTLKRHLTSGALVRLDQAKVRPSLYRPFTRHLLYFDPVLIDRPAHLRSIFPDAVAEHDNRLICVQAVASSKPFHCLMTDRIPDLHVTGDSQCFPFYTYAEDGTARRESITGWALERFRDHYRDITITKWDIFHYVYALLHHPTYRERYAANLRRDLPRVPLAPDFRAFAAAGERLSALHTGYESQPAYPLTWIENSGAALDYKVRKMRLSGDKRQIKYNEYLTLDGVPARALDYRLGNRSALEWVLDQYQVTTDPRSGILNDPNRPEDPQYILRLISQVITISLETVKIVEGLPPCPPCVELPTSKE